MEKINLAVADKTQMQAYVSPPEGKARAAIIILQEAFGVNHHIQDLTKRFAQEGYLAIAPELFHRTAAPGFTVSYTDFPSAAPHLNALTTEGMQQDVQACYDWLQKNQTGIAVAASGYCMGGRAAFVANAVVPLKCAVSYYGGQIATKHLNLVDAQKSPLLFFWGGLDKHIPPEQIQEVNKALTAKNKKFTCVEISDADHGFFCDEKPVFNPAASRQAWALTLDFLKEYTGR